MSQIPELWKTFHFSFVHVHHFHLIHLVLIVYKQKDNPVAEALN